MLSHSHLTKSTTTSYNKNLRRKKRETKERKKPSSTAGYGLKKHMHEYVCIFQISGSISEKLREHFDRRARGNIYFEVHYCIIVYLALIRRLQPY